MRSSGSMASWGRASRDVLVQPCRRALADRHVAVFLALALAHHDQATVKLKIEQFQIDDFQPPQSGRIDHFQDGAIAQTQTGRRGWAASSPARPLPRRGCSWATCGPARGKSISDAGLCRM